MSTENLEKRYAGLTIEQENLLIQISKDVHAIYANVAHREVPISPAMKFLMEKAMEDPDFPEDKKAKIKELYDTGEFSKTNTVTDPKIAKKMNAEIQRRINIAVKKGLLPSKQKRLKPYELTTGSGSESTG